MQGTKYWRAQLLCFSTLHPPYYVGSEGDSGINVTEEELITYVLSCILQCLGVPNIHVFCSLPVYRANKVA